MILQQKQVDRAYALNVRFIAKPTQSLSVPGQAFNIKLAMEMYKKGQPIEKVKGFYEKEGFECPDFNMMSRIEKLQALADYRILRKEKAEKLDTTYDKANQKFNQHVLEQKAKNQAKQSKPGGDSDTGKPPVAV